MQFLLTARQIDYAAHNVADKCEEAGHTVSVEEVQDLVENEIMALHKFVHGYVQAAAGAYYNFLIQYL